MNNVHILNIHIILIVIFGKNKKKKDKKWKCEKFCQKTKQNKKQINHVPIINIHIKFC